MVGTSERRRTYYIRIQTTVVVSSQLTGIHYLVTVVNKNIYDRSWHMWQLSVHLFTFF
jgi:hypothetical protein